MRQNTLQQLVPVIKRNKRSRIWQKIVRAMACVVVFCTTYALILPAITMTTPANCGLEEHTHTQECYVQTVTTLVCEAAESDADVLLHTHASNCYDAGGSLICTLPEIIAHTHSGDCYETIEVNPSTEDNTAETVPPQETFSAETLPQESTSAQAHTHSDGCYETQQGDLICQTPAETYHTHEDACYGPSTEPNCGQAEAEAHTHGDGCYESVSALTCTTSESEGHAHGEACQDAEGNLICETPEAEGHTHSESCYSTETKLTCQKSEGEGHSHTDTCFGTALTCTIPEVTVHEHSSDCYEQVQNLICGLEEGTALTAASEPSAITLSASSEAANTVLSETAPAEPVLVCTLEELYLHTHTESCGDCGLPEVSSHAHTDACFRTAEITDETYTAPLTCTLAESEEHTHDFRCYGSWNLVCEIEEHTHNEQCASDPNADLETAADWEATFAHVERTGNWAQDVLLIAETQLGYTESEKNFTFFEDDPTLPRGYTRYGQWYGVPYGDWCGMFVSFCLNYAGVEEVPLNFGCRPWIEELSSEEIDLYRPAEEYTPNPGDIVFFDWDGDKLSDHVGLVYELIQPTEEELVENASAPIKVKTIEGNSSNRVQYVTYTLGEDRLLGYGDITAAQENYNLKREVRHTAEVVGEDFTVTVRYSDLAGIPEGAVLVAEEILPEDERYQSFLEQVEAETASEEEAAPVEITYFRALDVHFALGDQEIPLNAEVQVSVTFTEAEQEELNVAHFADDGTMDQPESTTELGETGDSTVSFNTDSFSGIVLYATATADVTGTTLYFTTVDPSKLEEGKNYAIYAQTSDDIYVFLSCLEQCPALTVTGADTSKPVTIGGVWSLTADQLNSYTLDGLSWKLELPTDTSATYKRLYSVGYDTDAYSGYEYLCFNKDDLQTWTSQEDKDGQLDLKITASGAGATILAADGTSYGRTKIYYNSGVTDVLKSWEAVASTGTATTVYFAEVSTECPHSYTYTATLPADCNDTAATATRTCSVCNTSETTDAASSISAITSYAEQLRAANIKDDYSGGHFTWDTEDKDRGWTYYNGVMLDAFMKVGTDEMHDYVAAFYDDVLEADGTPKGYISGEVDSVPMALALFDLLGDGNGAEDQRYIKAIQYVYDQLSKQTVLDSTYGNNYWHKTTSDSWATWKFGLDGIYMANTFLMEYANALEEKKLTNATITADQIYQTVSKRLIWVADTMYDETTGLYHHGWNGTNGNGHFWGRGIGWYAVAMVDIIEMMPSSYRANLTSKLPKLFDGMLRWQDSSTGMWYNVVNRDSTLTDNNGNKLETSVSSMMAYAMMKAYREGFVTDAKYGEAALRAIHGIVTNKMTGSAGSYSVADTYKSSGVKETDADYLTNTYTTNEAKGVGALIMAAAPDHNWTEWTESNAVATASTTTTVETTETRYCTVCSEVQTRTITSENTLIGYNFTVVDPDSLQDGEVYAVYANPSSENYVFLMSDRNPSAERIDTTTYEANGYGTAPQTIGQTWYVPVSYLGDSADAFTWQVEKDNIGSLNGELWLEALGYTADGDGNPVTQYLSIRDESSRNVQTYLPETTTTEGQTKNYRSYITLTVNTDIATSDVDARSTIVNENIVDSQETPYHLILASGDDWKTSSDNDAGNTDKAGNVLTSIAATPVIFAKVTPVYEEDTSVAETPDTSDRYQLTTVDPTKLQAGVDYVIYTKSTSDDDTYTFMFSNAENPPAREVSNTGYIVNPVTIDGKWSVSETELSETLTDFTWRVIPATDGTIQIVAQGYGTDQVICLTGPTEKGAALGNTNSVRDDLDVTHVGSSTSAACTLANHPGNATGDLGYQLAYDAANSKWITISPDGVATPVYFAAVTDKEAEGETYDLKVLGTTGPVEGKKYVIYFPYITTVTADDGTTSDSIDVKILGSLLNPGKGNYSRGANDVEDQMSDLIMADDSPWTLESSKMIGYTLAEIQWTVVEVDGDLCLQSVADPTLHLKLVCTNTSGASQVNSTAYDSQGAQYFSLVFESSDDSSDSFYTISTEDGATNLGFYEAKNTWRAIVDGYTPEDETEVNQFKFYIAEVVDDSTEEDSGTTDTTTEQKFAGYTFTTLDPDTLYDGQIVTLYYQNTDPDTYTFAYSGADIAANTVSDTGYNTQPVTVGNTWDMTSTQMGDSIAAFTWQVEKDEDGTIRLASLGYTPDNEDRFPGPEYLRLYTNADNSTSVQTWWNDTDPKNAGIVDLTITSGSGADCTISSDFDESYLVYDGTDWVFSKTEGSTVYFASVAPKYVDVPVGTNFPEGVHTGEPTVNTLRFYNFVESGGEHIAALPGCKFVITGANGYTYTIISGDNPELHLPSDIPDGTYTIEEVSAADGYMRDVNPKRSFTISGGAFTDGNSIGTFLNHADALVTADKVGEVEDYNNRTYEIMLNATSDLRLYQMNPVDVLFVVDQSNSMLFPAGLKYTGADVTLYRNEGITNYDERENNNTDQLDALMKAGKLNEDTVYYIIADENVTSTVYAIWYNGVTWMYQDASYYAKAMHKNAPGYQQADGELAVLPTNASSSEQATSGTVTYIQSYDSNGIPVYVTVKSDNLKANGGGLAYEIGNNTLGKDIAATATGTDDNGNTVNVGTQKTYRIYTATNNYNRLHYLQDALAHAIHQLADANPENTVTLIRFNRTTKNENCKGPLVLNTTNVNELITAVNSINTGGGTRQDIALEHAYNHLTGGTFFERGDDGKFTNEQYTLQDNYTKDGREGTAWKESEEPLDDPKYTFTVLITDGAPVGSGDEKNLGVADSFETSIETGKPVYDRIRGYAELVREESILMTIGLGMGGVQGGGTVLERIATGYVEGKDNIYHKMLEDAEDLMNTLKQLLFSSMMPREKVDLMGDITDVISDSFYPIAYTAKGSGAATGRKVLYSDDSYDWILLEPGDWITIEGEYVAPLDEGSIPDNAAGQLTVNNDGDFQITWDNQMIYDCELVWVPEGDALPEGKTLVTVDSEGRQWFALAENDQVYAHGEYYNPSNVKTGNVTYDFLENNEIEYAVAGTYKTVSGDSRAHIVWNDYYTVDFDANFQPYTWYGKFYVKAKEDFIGGNAIDTNKSAQITVEENDGDETTNEVIGTDSPETPTVNVRLLDMNETNTEVTVFLGDQINAADNAPLDSLKYFFDNTAFDKLVDDFEEKPLGDGSVLDYGPIMNAIDPERVDDGLLENAFYLRYAMGRTLTDEEWTTLVGGGTVTVEYTYDDPSSHGPVGYFTFQLTKTGTTADYAQHEATKACDKQHVHENCTAPVETYTLHVTYTAYKFGEGPDADNQRPTENVHNDTADIDGDQKTAGIQVGTGTTLSTGLGKVDKDNVHKVHVISGKVEVTKEVNDVNTVDQTFTFTLHREEDGTSEENDQTLTVKVKAGETSGTAVTALPLELGTWVLTETPVLGYQLDSMAVIDNPTNCYSTVAENKKSVTFEIGDNEQNVNVIGTTSIKAGTTKAENNTDTIPTAPTYTTYTGTPNGVYGAAKVVNVMMTYELPESGGAGITSYTLGGLLLISLAVCLFLVYNYKSRREDMASS